LSQRIRNEILLNTKILFTSHALILHSIHALINQVDHSSFLISPPPSPERKNSHGQNQADLSFIGLHYEILCAMFARLLQNNAEWTTRLHGLRVARTTIFFDGESAVSSYITERHCMSDLAACWKSASARWHRYCTSLQSYMVSLSHCYMVSLSHCYVLASLEITKN
jgi:hypothetical protein